MDMKETEMKTREHIVAVVEPTRDGESTIELAQEVVDRGGRATVVVLITKHTRENISAFAHSEAMTYADAEEIYLERLADFYTSRLGDEAAAAIVTDDAHPSQVVFNTASRSAATSVAMPQRLATRRGWKAAVARSIVPVLIAPPTAA
jgi:hypothetical protein